MWAWLAALYVVAVVVQLALGLRVSSPWIMVDELVYSDMARSFARHGRFLIRGVHANYGFVYPLLLSPAYALFGSSADVYSGRSVINALVMSLGRLPGIPARAPRRAARGALAAAALAVAIPPMVYVGTLMTENAFYPVFLVARLALVARARAADGATAAARPRALRARVPDARAGRRARRRGSHRAARARLDRARPAAAALGVEVAVRRSTPARACSSSLVEVARGKSPSQLLGGYSVTTRTAGTTSGRSIRWIVYHVAELDLSLFVIPFAAFIVLVASARHLDRPLRVFCAAAAPLVVWLMLEVGVVRVARGRSGSRSGTSSTSRRSS